MGNQQQAQIFYKQFLIKSFYFLYTVQSFKQKQKPCTVITTHRLTDTVGGLNEQTPYSGTAVRPSLVKPEIL